MLIVQFCMLLFPFLLQLVVDIFGLTPVTGGGFKQSGVMENSTLVSQESLNCHVPCLRCIYSTLEYLTTSEERRTSALMSFGLSLHDSTKKR